jgi:hypothetical protein
VPLEGHWKRVNTPLRSTTRREGRALVAVVTILVIGLVIGLYAALHDGSSSKAEAGCIEVTAAHTTGGATLRACGPAAVRWCRSARAREDALARAVQARCSRAGYR